MIIRVLNIIALIITGVVLPLSFFQGQWVWAGLNLAVFLFNGVMFFWLWNLLPRRRMEFREEFEIPDRDLSGAVHGRDNAEKWPVDPGMELEITYRNGTAKFAGTVIANDSLYITLNEDDGSRLILNKDFISKIDVRPPKSPYFPVSKGPDMREFPDKRKVNWEDEEKGSGE
jgi:hypothetical protein